MGALFRAARLRPLATFALIGLAIHIAVFARFATPDDFWSLFLLWITAPVLATLLFGIVLPRSAQSFWFCLLAGAPVLFGLAAYLSLLLGKPDAQAGLAFLFTPLWQLLALPVVWLVASVAGLICEIDD